MAEAYCKGSGRTPTETAVVGSATWGRCRRCRQWRPLSMSGFVKVHDVIAGLVPEATP